MAMTESDRSILMSESLIDERKRDRISYDYSFDVLAQQWIVPFSIWPSPNKIVKQILAGDIGYDDTPFDPDNEVQKGVFWKEQAEFVAKHADQKILCEALGKTCILHECRLFIAAMSEGHEQPVCREYKFMYAKGGIADAGHDIDGIKIKEPAIIV